MDDSIPIIVGVGRVTRRTTDVAELTEPADLIASAARMAAEDGGLTLSQLAGIDRIDIIKVMSWPYLDVATTVAAMLGATGASCQVSPTGGDQPVALLSRAATELRERRATMVLVAGGEALHARKVHRLAGSRVSWSGRAPGPSTFARATGMSDLARRHGLTEPAFVYPLFEQARRARVDATPRIGQRRSAAIQARLSEVAVRTPGAWLRHEFSADEIAAAGPHNRWVSWPYTKYMCANPTVDQAAALILTTVGQARTWGLDLRRAIHLWSDGSAAEPLDVLSRPDLSDSQALRTALQTTVERAGLEPSEIDLHEFYSCFPVVPWMAADALGLPLDRETSVAGGLTFFGGPANAYIACATVVMVERLRGSPNGTFGLVHGNGLYATRHRAIVLANVEAPRSWEAAPDDLASGVPLVREARVDGAISHVVVETSTVIADSDGQLTRGVAVCRTPKDSRVVARIAGETLDLFTDLDHHSVGLTGRVEEASESGELVFWPDGGRRL